MFKEIILTVLLFIIPSGVFTGFLAQTYIKSTNYYYYAQAHTQETPSTVTNIIQYNIELSLPVRASLESLPENQDKNIRQITFEASSLVLNFERCHTVEISRKFSPKNDEQKVQFVKTTSKGDLYLVEENQSYFLGLLGYQNNQEGYLKELYFGGECIVIYTDSIAQISKQDYADLYLIARSLTTFHRNSAF